MDLKPILVCLARARKKTVHQIQNQILIQGLHCTMLTIEALFQHAKAKLFFQKEKWRLFFSSIDAGERNWLIQFFSPHLSILLLVHHQLFWKVGDAVFTVFNHLILCFVLYSFSDIVAASDVYSVENKFLAGRLLTDAVSQDVAPRESK